MGRIVINGHPLPWQLVNAIATGRWQQPRDPAVIETAFGETPVHPSFYGLEGLVFENSSWVNEQDPSYLGVPDSVKQPGDLDPTRSVLIGDLGPDRPFALDYRTECPQIVYLREDGRWTLVASNIGELFRMLEIDD